MKISRTRSLTVNLGNYGERWQAGATVTISHNDLGFSDEEWTAELSEDGEDGEILRGYIEDAGALALSVVNEILEAELDQAEEVRAPNEPSFLDHFGSDRK